MKKVFLPIFILLMMVSAGFAQPATPQFINYQAVARNSAGEILANTAVSIRISILDGTATGAVVYSETHNPTTNQFGLFSLKIGGGTVLSGTFTGIDWGADLKFLRVEMDATGGTSYTVMGTTQLVSVPYALYAESAEHSNWADGADEADYAENANIANSLSGANDISNTNEIQSLGLSGNTLSLSNGGGNVTLPSIWSQNGSDIYYNSGNIGIHTDEPTADLHFKYTTGGTFNTGSSFIRFQRTGGNAAGFTIGHSKSIFGTHAFFFSRDGGINFYTGDDGVNPRFQITSEGNLKLGTGGSQFVEIKEITGTTNASGYATQIPLPEGYTSENTRVLSIEFKNTANNWLAELHRFSDDNILRYYIGGTNITIYHPDHPSSHNRPVRIILMKMP